MNEAQKAEERQKWQHLIITDGWRDFVTQMRIIEHARTNDTLNDAEKSDGNPAFFAGMVQGVRQVLRFADKVEKIAQGSLER